MHLDEHADRGESFQQRAEIGAAHMIEAREQEGIDAAYDSTKQHLLSRASRTAANGRARTERRGRARVARGREREESSILNTLREEPLTPLDINAYKSRPLVASTGPAFHLDEPNDIVAPIRLAAERVAAPLVVLASDGAAAHVLPFLPLLRQ